MILEYSQKKYNSFLKVNPLFNITNLNYAKIGQNYDLSLSRAEDYASIERICKDPKKMNLEERNQLLLLNKWLLTYNYSEANKCAPNTIFLKQGQIILGAENKNQYPDIDAIVRYNNQIVVIFYKCANGNGGCQSDQFQESLRFVKESPMAGNDKLQSILLVTGSFFSSKKIALLRSEAWNKNCQILTNNELLKELNENEN